MLKAGDDLSLTTERQGAVEILTLNRPSARNALNLDMVSELSRYFYELQERESVRVVILRGEGIDFCAGLDLGHVPAQGGESGGPSRGISVQRKINRIYKHMHHAPQPIIALVNGAAAGGGMSLALAADVRIGAPAARFNAAYIRIGFTGGDMGSTYFLPRLVGQSRASEMVLTGNFMLAEEAQQCGLVSRIVESVELLPAGLRLADDMLRNSPLGLRLTKESLRLNTDAPSLEAAMALEDRQQILLGQSQDQKEGLSAFIEKRAPQYKDN